MVTCTSIRLGEALGQRATVLAAMRGMSRSALVRKLLEREIKNAEPHVKRALETLGDKEGAGNGHDNNDSRMVK